MVSQGEGSDRKCLQTEECSIFPSCEWTIHRFSLSSKAAEQKDGVDHAWKFCDGGVQALREMDEDRLIVGGPRRRYGERKVQTRRMG